MTDRPRRGGDGVLSNDPIIGTMHKTVNHWNVICVTAACVATRWHDECIIRIVKELVLSKVGCGDPVASPLSVPLRRRLRRRVLEN